MKSPLIRICNIADSVLKNMGYDPERLGIPKDEMNEIRRVIETITTKEEFAQVQINADLMRIIDSN